MTGFFDEPDPADDRTRPATPAYDPHEQHYAAAYGAAPTDPYGQPLRDPYGDGRFGAQVLLPGQDAEAADVSGQGFGELPYVHAAPRTVRPLGRKVAVAAGSLVAGALAAGAAAFAMGGGDDASVALANTADEPSATAEVTIDPSTRTQEVSRGDLRPGTCVRLDADALAAIEAAQAGGADADADGRTVTVQLADGDVSVPVSAVKVVKCTVPKKAKTSASSSSADAPSSSSSSAAKKPAASSTTKAKASSSSTKPRTTTTTKPVASTTKPRTTTTTKPRTTTKTSTPKPSSSTKTSAS